LQCSIIIDLLPLYGADECSEETKEIVSNHLVHCESCKELYVAMHHEVGLKNYIEIPKKSVRVNEFWYLYYRRLLIKVLSIFLVAFCIVIGIKVILNFL